MISNFDETLKQQQTRKIRKTPQETHSKKCQEFYVHDAIKSGN